MKGFTAALGVRCSYCHKGEEGKPLSTFDFVSDENPNKNRAREMYKMLGSINDHLKNIQPSGDKRVNMWCNTCHRGRPKPATLDEELGESYRKGGIKAAVAHYNELRGKFYGRGAYDFGELPLNNFGYELMNGKDISGAIEVLTINTKEFPESANVWDSLAEAYMKQGDNEKARTYYERSLQLDPTNENAKTMLKKFSEEKK